MRRASKFILKITREIGEKASANAVCRVEAFRLRKHSAIETTQIQIPFRATLVRSRILRIPGVISTKSVSKLRRIGAKKSLDLQHEYKYKCVEREGEREREREREGTIGIKLEST